MRERTKDLQSLRGLGLALVVAGISAPACGQASKNGGTGGAAGAGSSAFGGSAGAFATDGRSGGSSSIAGASTAETGGAPAGSGVGGGAGRDDAGASAGGPATGQPGGAGGGAGGSSGSAAADDDGGQSGASGVGGDAGMGGLCSAALPLKCGDRWNHSTVDDGRPNRWLAYGLTARAETGRETVYAFDTASDCSVVANLENLTTDLDLLLLSSCDSRSNVEASSTPIDLQTVETLSWTNPAGTTFYVVVDGYGGDHGSYTLDVDCTCN